MGALDGGCIVQRGLSQRLSVFLLADLALAHCQVELGLLFGQRAGGLGGRVVLAIQAGEGGFCLRHAFVDVLRRVLLRLAGFNIRDLLLDVLARLGVLRFLGGGEHARGHCLGARPVEVSEFLIQPLGLRQRTLVGGIQRIQTLAPLLLDAAPLLFLFQSFRVGLLDALPLLELFLKTGDAVARVVIFVGCVQRALQVGNLLLQLGNGLAFALDALPPDTGKGVEDFVRGVLDVEPAAFNQTKVLANLGCALPHGFGIGALCQVGSGDSIALVRQGLDLGIHRRGKESVLLVQFDNAGDRVLAKLDELGDRLLYCFAGNPLHLDGCRGDQLQVACGIHSRGRELRQRPNSLTKRSGHLVGRFSQGDKLGFGRLGKVTCQDQAVA
ncbi:hypothetical protein D3C77_311790 [compost metagenome]